MHWAVEQFLNFIVSAIGGLIGYYLFEWFRPHPLARKNDCQPPRRYPHKDPIFGLDNLLRTGKAIAQDRSLPDIQDRYDKLGRTFVTSSWAFRNVAIASIEPENLRTVWVTNFEDWGVQPFRLKGFEPFLGRGFASVDGAEWEHSKALIKPSFRRANISNLEPFEGFFQQFLAQLPKDGSTVDLQVHFSHLYLDTASFFLFGESFGFLSGKRPQHAEGFLEAFQDAMSGSALRMIFGPLASPFKKNKWLEACATVHRFADRYVAKALKYREEILLDEKSETDTNISSRSLLYSMVEQTGDPIELRNLVIQTFMAALDTTANLLSNIFFLLSRDPVVFHKLRTEVLSITGDLDYNKLMGMKYLQNIINEALRLYPVLPTMNRVAITDTTLPTGGGPDGSSPIFVPKGTRFDTSFYALHRIPEIWGPEAELFRPERWESIKPKAWEYAPFTGGPRACSGQQKALLETAYVVVRMLQEFRAVESRDDRPWTGRARLTAKNANGCLVGLIPA